MLFIYLCGYILEVLHVREPVSARVYVKKHTLMLRQIENVST